jgi:hypothetical protein
MSIVRAGIFHLFFTGRMGVSRSGDWDTNKILAGKMDCTPHTPKVCTNEANMLVQHHPTLLDETY